MSEIQEQLVELTNAVWQTVLKLDAHFVSEVPQGALDPGIISGIPIVGAYNGAIILDCPSSIARVAASMMFNKEVADVDGKDEFDAMQELANVIGGNAIGALPATSRITLPFAMQRDKVEERLAVYKQEEEVSFRCEAGFFRILVMKRVASKAKS